MARRLGIDERMAARARQFIGFLKHTKSPFAGVPFVLEGWQWKKIIRPLFGTVDPVTGLRRYRTCYVEIPRKNGKSELAAAVALYLLFADGEQGAEIYSAAADRDQAAIVFKVAARMVELCPALMRRCKIHWSTKTIEVPDTGSSYRVLSSEVASKHGYNASGIIFDELHAQRTRELWDVLTTSGGTRSQPLVFAITTAGFDRNSICWEQHHYSDRLLDGHIEDPSFLPVIFSAPQDANWTDKRVWHKCNPALGVFRSLEEMRDLCRKAKEVPALENTFRRLYLNQWTSQETRWLPMRAWDACDAPTFTETDLYGRPCYAGLDLASTIDLAALVLVFPPVAEGEAYKVLPYFFIPKEGMRERSRRDRVPYDLWVRSKRITATPGAVIDFGHILGKIDEVARKFDVQEVAYDRYGATYIVQILQDRGLEVVEFSQQIISMSPGTKELLRLVMAGELAHSGNPVLRWQADNLMVITDSSGNVKPDRKKSTEKIDGIVALIMALDRALCHEDHKSVYETRGFMTLD